MQRLLQGKVLIFCEICTVLNIVTSCNVSRSACTTPIARTDFEIHDYYKRYETKHADKLARNNSQYKGKGKGKSWDGGGNNYNPPPPPAARETLPPPGEASHAAPGGLGCYPGNPVPPFPFNYSILKTFINLFHYAYEWFELLCKVLANCQFNILFVIQALN